jgi:hypothetical protein
MICNGIGYVADGGSVIFSCMEKENNLKITKENYVEYFSKYVTTFKLYRNFSDIESENYGKFQKFKGVDKDNFKWVENPTELFELSEAIQKYINTPKGEKDKSWFRRSGEMKKLTRESRLYKLLENDDIED